MSSIKARPSPSGWGSCGPMTCALCCAGARTTSCSMRRRNRRLTWKIAQGKRGWSQRWVWDARRARWVVASVLVLSVAHLDHPQHPFSLVVCRSQGRSPWYLLTAEPITTDAHAWQVVFVYMRSFQIELSWKYEKSELASLRPRVYEGQAREKLLRLSTLAYAFLLTLLQAPSHGVRLWLLRYYCHRT